MLTAWRWQKIFNATFDRLFDILRFTLITSAFFLGNFLCF